MTQYALIDLFTGEIVGKPTEPKRNARKAKPGWIALAEVCGYVPEHDKEGHIDWRALTDTERGMLNRFYSQIERAEKAAGVEDEEEIAEAVRGFWPWFRKHDWRGQRNQKPTPADVAKSWTPYRVVQEKTGIAESWMKYADPRITKPSEDQAE